MNRANKQTPLQVLSPIQTWEIYAGGKFATCMRCSHSFELKTLHGPSYLCGATPGNQSIGSARAVGKPCGPDARLAAGPCIQALSLEITESETSAGDWARPSARSQSRKDAQP